jgi:hypothetical protein
MTIQTLSRLLFVLVVLIALPGCEIVGGIFKAGVGVGIFLAVVVVAVIFALVTKTRS